MIKEEEADQGAPVPAARFTLFEGHHQ